ENAIRYAPPGGRVGVSVLPGEGSAELIVEDNGPGIPEHERERVFDAFYRILGNGEQTGSGLGLAIVKAVADGAGATVALEDGAAPGQGLRVRVRFPLSSAFSAPPAA
ncbi:MAG TPA: sensor histidine kinase, partial [Massilia sp.]|nr:sensor histidine kinase [Massilia sp.]